MKEPASLTNLSSMKVSKSVKSLLSCGRVTPRLMMAMQTVVLEGVGVVVGVEVVVEGTQGEAVGNL